MGWWDGYFLSFSFVFGRAVGGRGYCGGKYEGLVGWTGVELGFVIGMGRIGEGMGWIKK